MTTHADDSVPNWIKTVAPGEQQCQTNFHVHDVTFLKLEITTGIDDDVGEAVPLLADVHVVDARQVERFHARSDEVGNLGPLDHLRVVVPRLVHQVDRVLRHQQGDILLVSGGAIEEMDGWLDEGAAAERTPCARVQDTSRQRWKELRVDRQKDMIRNTVSKHKSCGRNGEKCEQYTSHLTCKCGLTQLWSSKLLLDCSRMLAEIITFNVTDGVIK